MYAAAAATDFKKIVSIAHKESFQNQILIVFIRL